MHPELIVYFYEIIFSKLWVVLCFIFYSFLVTISESAANWNSGWWLFCSTFFLSNHEITTVDYLFSRLSVFGSWLSRECFNNLHSIAASQKLDTHFETSFNPKNFKMLSWIWFRRRLSCFWGKLTGKWIFNVYFFRYKLLNSADTRWETDGLNVTSWKVVKVSFYI